MNTPQLASVVKDIRFWIVFFFIIRLYAITNPPLEVGHNWRQTDGTMIIRNFYERGANIFYPMVDVAGEKTGIVGSEFPILNYLVYIVCEIFGYEHWYGRLVVLLFSCLGVYFFNKLISAHYGEKAAFNCSIILLVSFWFSYSRKIIPDVFSASLCITSLYYGVRYLKDGGWRCLVLFFTLGLLACLSKILVATILTVLLIPFLDRNNLIGRKILISIFSVGILGGVCWWYFFWVPYLNETYGLKDHFFMGYSFSEGAKDLISKWPVVLKRFYDTPLKFSGFALFLMGLYFIFRKRDWTTLAVFLLPFVSYVVLLTKTGSSISGDTYYVITVIPCMAFVAGWGLTQIKNQRIVAVLLVAVAVEGIAAQIYDFRIRQPYQALADLEQIMDGVSDRNDLIVVNSEVNNPTTMYFAHRRGWTAPNVYFTDSVYVKDIRTKGCKFAVVAKKLYGDLELTYPVVHDSEYFRIYDLR
jgi:hypothetical protein